MVKNMIKQQNADIMPTIRGVIIDIGVVLKDFDYMTSEEIKEWIEDTRKSLLEIVEPIEK